MGLSIHYSGRIRNPKSLPSIIEEVRDIARINKWKLSTFNEELPAQITDEESIDGTLYGVAFSPPNCEPVWLSFLSNGKMSSPVALQFLGGEIDEQKNEYLYQLSTKTQFAGAQTHQLIIHLFKYLEQKYLDEFTLIDEGEYWETGDKNVLETNFVRYSLLLDVVEQGLKNMPRNPGESVEDFVERVLKNLPGKGNPT
ncbi:MAG: hypothetical protein RIE86_19895 [Imperialibacter sp.]|uniref:hypothetical protein n=1 Tax=Imperialibacter sp. TaxID=2038411 RepID=UPI0032EB2769